MIQQRRWQEFLADIELGRRQIENVGTEDGKDDQQAKQRKSNLEFICPPCLGEDAGRDAATSCCRRAIGLGRKFRRR
ncbi:hypothetical protein [Bradyrhizobium sp. ERR14]|uniref:hypothetical protein n=1 Tax=Bradyrhizobium sp. ERR14 TaxID=2663837 RepID=UPI0017E51319|nr:hypothetical protein [Bradyrhizobium sp. ERR14]MBB4398935.1 hypothetical protein [Bradyrhizobium sp. ERR14]